LSRRFVVFTPGGPAIASLVERSAQAIGRVADPEVVRKIVSHNPDNLWAIARRSRYDAADPKPEGFFAFLMLNAEGLKRLADKTLDGTNPDLSCLTAQSERPAGIYSWAMYAQGGMAAALPLIMEKISSPLYQGVDIFGRCVTAQGTHFTESIGLLPGAVINGRVVPHLHWLKRSNAPDIGAPLYDSYRASNAPGQISVATVRTVEDLMRVFSVRSAVYVAEQLCPHEEEFDGNDFCATHLLGYVGHEPAGSIRIRCFADFAKVERVAIRKEFRNTRLAHKMVRAATELCRAKGYRRLYGQPRTDLVRFYSRFGWRLLEGGKPLRFSDVDYVEMVMDLEPVPNPVSIGVDPYMIIRPEGRWHVPGILDRSAQRRGPAP
jgi:predicted GNAT family N-acyltransferase